ncbi:MAG: hypothetical protein J6M53_02015, partial [Bacteroidaceae bacterium]|nr:hypothetical protein [Bacteroidaceae bacterium]
PSAADTLGVVVTCRGALCFFESLAADSAERTLALPATALGEGVNVVELIDTTGRTLATRLVWADADRPPVRLAVQQNAQEYGPFDPVCLNIALTAPTDTARRDTARATLSVAVREAASLIAEGYDDNMAADMLLSSELRGYVHRPSAYFAMADSLRLPALDLLLMVQGWRANSFAELCRRDSFDHPHPIEEAFIVSGTVMQAAGKDGTEWNPAAHADLRLTMFDPQGYHGKAEGKADAQGRFVFASNVDFHDACISIFRISPRRGRERDCRIRLNRWFGGGARAFDWRELDILPPRHDSRLASELYADELFEWPDTLPRLPIPSRLQTAVVTARNPVRGLARYSIWNYRGGEAFGLRHGSVYVNFDRELELLKDETLHSGSAYWAAMMISRKYLSDYSTTTLAGTAEADTMAWSLTTTEPQRTVPAKRRHSEYFGEEPIPEMPGKFIKVAPRTNFYVNNIGDPEQRIVAGLGIYGIPAEWVRHLIIMKKHKGEKKPTSGEYGMYTYLREDYVSWDTKEHLFQSERKVSRRGEKRVVYGFASPTRFYSPDYSHTDIPTDEDHRRTLYWNPALRVTSASPATCIFFGNAHDAQRLRISVRGLTDDGRAVSLER